MVYNSLIIPVFNGSRYLPLFWNTLLNNIDSSYELIIIDDASEENIVKTIPEEYSQFSVIYIKNEVNIGYAASVNKGIKEANGDTLFLLNTDLIFKKDTLKELKKPLLEDKQVGIVGAKLLYPQTNRIQHFGVAFSKTRKFHVYTHMDKNNSILMNNMEVQASTFALVCFKKQLCKDIGILNEKYFNGCEDIDYSLRANEANYKIVIAAEATAFHWESQSGTARHISSHDNEARFWADWGHKIKLDYLKFIEININCFLKGEKYKNKDAIVINLSSSIDSLDSINEIKKGFSIVEEIFDFRQKNNAKYHLWLPMILPLEYIRFNFPIIYFVDEVTQMTQNFYWFSIRNTYQNGDVIIDNYANVIGMEELQSMFVPTRLKTDGDVS